MLIRYDLSQILYDYIVEVTSGFNGLDLKDRVPEELWMEICNITQDTVFKNDYPKEKEIQQGKVKQ